MFSCAQIASPCSLEDRPLLWIHSGLWFDATAVRLFTHFRPTHLYTATASTMALHEAGLPREAQHAIVVDVGESGLRVTPYYGG